MIIPLKLSLGMVPGSSTDVTRALRGCFREGCVYVSFLFVSKRRKTSNDVRRSSFNYKQRCFGSRCVLIHLETLIGV